jgi:hypothetical protein
MLHRSLTKACHDKDCRCKCWILEEIFEAKL